MGHPSAAATWKMKASNRYRSDSLANFIRLVNLFNGAADGSARRLQTQVLADAGES
jgi:hypothetical protein